VCVYNSYEYLNIYIYIILSQYLNDLEFVTVFVKHIGETHRCWGYLPQIQEFVKHMYDDKVRDFRILEFVTHTCAGGILPQMKEFVKHMCDDQVRDIQIIEFVTHTCAGGILPQMKEFVKHMCDDQVCDMQ